jgi:hypothetical protein
LIAIGGEQIRKRRIQKTELRELVDAAAYR